MKIKASATQSMAAKPLWLLLGVMPWLVAPAVFMYFDAAARAVCLLSIAGVFIIQAGSFATLFQDLLSRRNGRLFVILVVAFAISCIVSALLSPHRELAFFGTGWRRLGAVSWIAILASALWAAADLSTHPEHLTTMLRVIAVPGLAVSLYGISQYLGWDPILHADRVQFSMRFRPPGTFGNPTYFANYLIYVIFAAIGLVYADSIKVWRIIGWITIIIAAFAVLLTGTRSAILGVALGSAILMVQLRPKVGILAVSLAVLLGLAVTGFVWSPAGGKLRDRIQQWREDPAGGPRTLVWRDALSMARVNPLLGRGPETFATDFPPFQSKRLARAYPDNYEESAHNILLDALTAQGALGVILLTAISILGMTPLRTLRVRGMSSILSAAVAAGFFSHQFTVFIIPTAVLYFVFIAAALAAQKTLNMNAMPGLFGRFTPPSWLAYSVGAVLIVAAVQIAYVDVSWRLVREHLDSGEVQDAMAAYAGVSKLRPVESGLDLWFARALAERSGKAANQRVTDQTWPYVLQASRRACLTSEDRQNAFYNLALMDSFTNDLDGMESALRSAVEYAPNWYKPHWLLAQLLFHAQRLPAAETEAGIAWDLSGGKHPEVKDLFDAIQQARRSD